MAEWLRGGRDDAYFPVVEEMAVGTNSTVSIAGGDLLYAWHHVDPHLDCR